MSDRSVKALLSDVIEGISSLTSDTTTLAKAEIKQEGRKVGIGIAMFAGAAFLALFAVILLTISLAYGLVALGLAPWLAFLIVAAFFLLLIAGMVWYGIRKFKSITGPIRTTAAVKAGVKALSGSILSDLSDDAPGATPASPDTSR